MNIGDAFICAETGKLFTVARDGCSFNYATGPDGSVYSDEGVNIRERRGMLDRTKPFWCYVSGDGRHVTGWKGNILGTIVSHDSYVNNWGARIYCWRIVDIHGNKWHGRNSGRGMCVTLRASKG